MRYKWQWYGEDGEFVVCDVFTAFCRREAIVVAERHYPRIRTIACFATCRDGNYTPQVKMRKSGQKNFFYDN